MSTALATLSSKVGYITDPLLLNIIEVDTLRPKTSGQTVPHITFDTSIAVVGNVNITGSAILKVDGLDIVSALEG